MIETRPFLEIMDGRKKGTIVMILYSPKEYTITKTVTNQTEEKNSLENTQRWIFEGNLRTLTCDLFYDTLEEYRDVREYTCQITDLTYIDPDLHSQPPLKLLWGEQKNEYEPFFCVVESYLLKFIEFLSDGIPVKAVLSIRLKECKEKLNERERPEKELTS